MHARLRDGVAVADNDNDVDVFVTQVGAPRQPRNNGNGTFTDVTANAGVAGRGLCSAITRSGVGWLCTVS